MDVKKIMTGLVGKRLKGELAKEVMECLAKEGFRPEFIKKEGFVIFKIEGKIIYITFDEKDEQFIRLIFPRFYETTEEYKVLALYNMNYLNSKYKFAYLYMLSDGVISAAAEMLIPAEQAGNIIWKILGAVLDIATEFSEEMKKGFSV
jgi:hypothetical protein